MIYEPKRPDVAVFIDFENVYVSVRDKLDANPNFETIMDRCSDLGRVVVARAYADWYRYPRVTSALYANGIEPMYVPTYYYDKEMGRTGRAIKNSVDMNLCIDAMKTLYTTTNIEKFVLATGDRDFIPLVNSIRQQGKEVIVIGIGGAASAHLAQSADEFIFYEQLVGKAPPRATNGRQRSRPSEASRGTDEDGTGETTKPAVAVPAPEPDVYDVLVEAIHLVRQRGYVSTLGSLKLVMKELMGGDFKESRYRDLNGRPFAKFKDFVLDAERRNKVIIFTSGTVNEVFLPGEDPLKLSQFAADLKEEPADGGYDLATLNNGAGNGLPETTSPEAQAPAEAPPTSTTSRRRRRRSRGQRKAAEETPPMPEQPVLDSAAGTSQPQELPEVPPGEQSDDVLEQTDNMSSVSPADRFEYPVTLSAIFDEQPSDQTLFDILSDMGFNSLLRPEEKPGSEADRDLEAEAKYLLEQLLPSAETTPESAGAPEVELPLNLDFWQTDDVQSDTQDTDARHLALPEADPEIIVAEVAAWFGELQHTMPTDDADTTVSPVDADALAEKLDAWLAEADFRAAVAPDTVDVDDHTWVPVEAHMPTDMQTALHFDADQPPTTEDAEAALASMPEAVPMDEGVQPALMDVAADDQAAAVASMPEAVPMDEGAQPALMDVAADDQSAALASMPEAVPMDEGAQPMLMDVAADDQAAALADAATVDLTDQVPITEEAVTAAASMPAATLVDADEASEPVSASDAGSESATAAEQLDDDDHDKEAESIDPIIFDDTEWHMFTHTMAGFAKPVSFAQIFDLLREQRKQHNLTRTNEQIRTMVKQAINNGVLERVGRGKRVYYKLKSDNQPEGHEEVPEQ